MSAQLLSTLPLWRLPDSVRAVPCLAAARALHAGGLPVRCAETRAQFCSGVLPRLPVTTAPLFLLSCLFSAARVDLVSLLKLQPLEDSLPWSAWTICEAWAEQRSFFTTRAGRPDLYRAANDILRHCGEERRLRRGKRRDVASAGPAVEPPCFRPSNMPLHSGRPHCSLLQAARIFRQVRRGGAAQHHHGGR